MIRRLFVLLASCPLLACASATAKAAALPDAGRENYTYEVAVSALPEDVSELVLTVELPGPSPSRVLSLHGLVGNAPFEVPLSPEHDVSFENEHVSLSLTWEQRTLDQSGSLRLTTHGKPLEFGLRFSLPGAAPGAAEFEQALVASTVAAADGRPLEAVATRFEHVR